MENVSELIEKAADSKTLWQTPTVTRIDIKRTMFSSGTGTDGTFVSP